MTNGTNRRDLASDCAVHARRAAVVLAALAIGACSSSEGATPSPTITTVAAPTTTTTAAPPTTTTTTAPPPVVDATLRPGMSGAEVLGLQQRLGELGYWLGEPDGTYGHLTEQAVLAFQKAEGLGRDGIAGLATLMTVQVAERPLARDTTEGIEIDLDRQLLLVVRGGAVQWAINTSTGRSGWRTPAGDFTITRQVDGVRRAPLGDLYRPKYFRGGVAVHGSRSIPAQPASHGCARVSNAAMDMLWSSGLADLGTPVRVY
jgi:lipoprotein-anchoring transpeptidase ErfK/SrfK